VTAGPAELANLRHLFADGTSLTEAACAPKISRSTAFADLATDAVAG
jgi:hypothetical protein